MKKREGNNRVRRRQTISGDLWGQQTKEVSSKMISQTNVFQNVRVGVKIALGLSQSLILRFNSKSQPNLTLRPQYTHKTNAN